MFKKNIGLSLNVVYMALLVLVPELALAEDDGNGGLSKGNTELNNIKLWVYGILGLGCSIYMAYLVGMVLLEKKRWGDVIVGLGTTAGAGAVLVVTAWAWTIWGS